MAGGGGGCGEDLRERESVRSQSVRARGRDAHGCGRVRVCSVKRTSVSGTATYRVTVHRGRLNDSPRDLSRVSRDRESGPVMVLSCAHTIAHLCPALSTRAYRTEHLRSCGGATGSIRVVRGMNEKVSTREGRPRATYHDIPCAILPRGAVRRTRDARPSPLSNVRVESAQQVATSPTGHAVERSCTTGDDGRPDAEGVLPCCRATAGKSARCARGCTLRERARP